MLIKDKFIKWYKRNFWNLSGDSLLNWNDDTKTFSNWDVQGLFFAWKAGRKSK